MVGVIVAKAFILDQAAVAPRLRETSTRARTSSSGSRDYLKRFTYCKGLESVWLLDTTTPYQQVRDNLKNLVGANDVVYVVRLTRDWAASNYNCGAWLNDEGRNW
jgi:hypothetical protein